MKDRLVRKDDGRLFLFDDEKVISALGKATFDKLWAVPFEETVKFVRQERQTGRIRLEGLGEGYIKKGEFNLIRIVFKYQLNK